MRIFLLLLMLGAAASAQTKAPAKKTTAAPTPKPPVGPAAVAWRLESLSVEGNRLYPAEKILAAARMKSGDTAGKAEFEAARDRLLATGYFESVAFRFEPVPDQPAIRGSFQVAEIPQVYAWRIEDLPLTREEFLREVAADPLFGERIPASTVLLQRLTASLQQALATKKFTDPVVVRPVSDKSMDLAIVLRPKANRPAVAEVRFQGNKALFEPEMRKAISEVAIGVIYTETTFRELLNNQIRPMYEAKGRLRVQFTKITTAPAADVKGLAVTVTVQEGDVYKLNSVTVNGAPFSSDQAQHLGEFKLGEVANFTEVQRGWDRVLAELKEDGYLEPEYRASRVLNDAEHTVDLTFNVDPGRQYMFGKLTVKGLDIETEPVIRKLWAMKPGQPYRYTYPRVFLERVHEGGYFDNLGETKFDTKTDENAAIVDVILVFKGQPINPADRRR